MSGARALLPLVWPLFSSFMLRAYAQAPARIPDGASCLRCTIAVSTIATLGNDDGLGSLSAPPNAVRVDARGRYWIIGGPDPPLLIDERGPCMGPARRLERMSSSSVPCRTSPESATVVFLKNGYRGVMAVL